MNLEGYRFVPSEFWLGQMGELNTEDGGKLVLTSGQVLPYEFSFGIKMQDEDEEMDILHSVVRLVDDQGAVWLGESIWTVMDFVREMTNFDSISPPAEFAKFGAQLQANFESACFFKKARGLLDDRFYHYLHLEGVKFIIPFKYQSPVLDLAFVQDRVVARVNGLYAHKSDEDADPIDVPAVLFQVRTGEKLFVNYGYQDESGCWEFDPIPRPFILKKLSTRMEPQSSIKYVAS